MLNSMLPEHRLTFDLYLLTEIKNILIQLPSAFVVPLLLKCCRCCLFGWSHRCNYVFNFAYLISRLCNRNCCPLATVSFFPLEFSISVVFRTGILSTMWHFFPSSALCWELFRKFVISLLFSDAFYSDLGRIFSAILLEEILCSWMSFFVSCYILCVSHNAPNLSTRQYILNRWQILEHCNNTPSQILIATL